MKSSTWSARIVSRCWFGGYVERGDRFEKLTIDTLQRSNFDLTQTGGAGDGGIDFVGDWKVSQGLNLAIIGQCKHMSAPVGVDVIRDFEGARNAFVSSTIAASEHSTGRSTDVVGIIVSASSFTKQARRLSSSLDNPQLLVTLSTPLAPSPEVSALLETPESSSEGQVLSVIPNRSFLRCFPHLNFARVAGRWALVRSRDEEQEGSLVYM